MVPKQGQQSISPLSLLDRLFDDNPESKEDGQIPFAEVYRKWEAALLRDIESLFNTRRASEEVPEEFELLTNSLVNYGLPDFTGISLKNPSDQNYLRAAIEDNLRRFEPRLTSVRVSLRPASGLEAVLRFQVSALIHIGDEVQAMRFATVLKGETGQIAVIVLKERP